MLRWLQVANDQPSAVAFIPQGQIPTGDDLQRGSEANVQICQSGVHKRQIQIAFRQVVLPVQNVINQVASAAGSAILGSPADVSGKLFPHRWRRCGPHVLPATFQTLFDEHVSVQFCQVLSLQTGSHVQPVDVLTDNVLDVASFHQGLQPHVGGRGDGLVKGNVNRGFLTALLQRPDTVWSAKVRNASACTYASTRVNYDVLRS